MKLLRAVVLVLAVSVAQNSLQGGEIVFKNGDRLTGEVTQLSDGRLKIKSAVAGEITVDLAKVATFSTDQEVQIKLKDGTRLSRQVTTRPSEGAVGLAEVEPATRPAGANEDELTLDKLATINETTPQVKWTGSLRAGAILARGNTDTDAFNLAGDAVRRYVDDRVSLRGQYLYGQQRNNDTGEKEATTDNWLVEGKYDHFFTKKLYGYTVAKVEADRIAELTLRTQPGGGLGYQWIESKGENFSTEIGAGYTYEKFKGEDSNFYVNARAAYHYDRKIRDNIKFINNVEYLPSIEDPSKFNINADAGLRVQFTERFFSELRFEWKHDSRPDDDANENDFRYILSVGWQF